MRHLKIKNALLVMTALFALLFVFLQCKVILMKDAYAPVKADCILVLGHSLEDGEAPGEWLTKRLEKGLALHEAGYADCIIVSGGKGPADNAAVASSMKQWLVEHDVDEKNIIVEEKAGNTYENMLFSTEILENNGFESVIVVTNDFHMYRSMLIAKQLFKQPSGASADVSLSFKKMAAYVKEPFSIMKYVVRYVFC